MTYDAPVGFLPTAKGGTGTNVCIGWTMVPMENTTASVVKTT